MKKNKIAYLIPSLNFFSGMERVLTLKANYLVEHYGYDIHIIITEGNESSFKLHKHNKIHQVNVNFDELSEKPLYMKLIFSKTKMRQLHKRMNECLCQLKPDITISMLRRDINCINYTKDGSIKLGEIHFNKNNYRDFDRKKMPIFLYKKIRKLWMLSLIKELKKLDRFIVLSHEDKAEWHELKNLEVIYNPLSFFPDQTSTCENKQVIAVGRFVPQKGFDLLIKAWAIVHKQHPEWKLRIYGYGEKEPYLNLINDCNIGESCILEKTVENIIEKYCESSIFVLSSRYEGFGLVLVEAMACGIPPVSFECPCGPKEIIKNGIDGFLVEKENINQLAEKIIFLIENEELRKQMGAKARKNVARFKIDNIAEEWHCLFSQLIKEKNGYKE